MLAMCWVIMFSALENAAPSAKRIVITNAPPKPVQPGRASPAASVCRDRRSARRLDLVLVLPPARRARLLGVGAQRGVLTEVLRGGPDAIGGRTQDVEVEVVAAGGCLAQQLPGILHRDAAEVAAQAFLGVR